MVVLGSRDRQPAELKLDLFLGGKCGTIRAECIHVKIPFATRRVANLSFSNFEARSQ